MYDAAFDAMVFMHASHDLFQSTTSNPIRSVKSDKSVFGFSPGDAVAFGAFDFVIF